MPALYVVATPIGNLEDISLRALRILREVKLIASEDTRKTRILLNAYDIKTPTTSYHEHNKKAKLPYLLKQLEESDIALVSEAGTPGISDPGHELIVAANQRRIPVIPIPGPAVAISAMVVSGLPLKRVLFVGFLPSKASARQKVLESLANEVGTIITFESPHRLIVSLKNILRILGDRQVAISRELTKVHEEVFRGTVGQAIEHFVNPKGEFTLVIAGKTEPEKPQLTEEIKMKLQDHYESGVKAKDAIGSVAEETGLSRKELYRAWLSLAREEKSAVKR